MRNFAFDSNDLMTGCSSKSKITCDIRCLDAGVVKNARQHLTPAGIQWIDYVCKISGKEEKLLLVGKQLASDLADALPDAEDEEGAKILAALGYAELCECDVATLTGLPEKDVVDRLERFAATGVLVHRMLHTMNYYRLGSELVRELIAEAIGSKA